jgi:hypothetical protein
VGYFIAAVIGVGVTVGVSWGIAKLLARKNDSTPTIPGALP